MVENSKCRHAFIDSTIGSIDTDINAWLVENPGRSIVAYTIVPTMVSGSRCTTVSIIRQENADANVALGNLETAIFGQGPGYVFLGGGMITQADTYDDFIAWAYIGDPAINDNDEVKISIIYSTDKRFND